jgi:hypothetical protein
MAGFAPPLVVARIAPKLGRDPCDRECDLILAKNARASKEGADVDRNPRDNPEADLATGIR